MAPPARNRLALATMKLESTLFIVADSPSTRAVAYSAAQAVGLRAETLTGVEELLGSDLDRPGCIVFAAESTGHNVVDTLARLAAKGVATPVIVLISKGDAATAIGALKKDAWDVLEAPVDEGTLGGSIKRALELNRLLRVSMAARSEAILQIERLTPREREVFELLCRGSANKRIAVELGCSIRTVELHRARLMAKLEAKSVADLLRAKLASEDAGSLDLHDGPAHAPSSQPLST